MFGFNRRRVTRELLAWIVPCFKSVQDEIGNVPPATHNDVRILATLYAVIYSQLAMSRIDTEDNKKAVTDQIFEEIFRREAVAILTYCDQSMSEGGSEFNKVFRSVYSASGVKHEVFNALKTYIDQHYEKQPYRDL